jgi:hypothetical protein
VTPLAAEDEVGVDGSGGTGAERVRLCEAGNGEEPAGENRRRRPAGTWEPHAHTRTIGRSRAAAKAGFRLSAILDSGEPSPFPGVLVPPPSAIVIVSSPAIAAKPSGERT